MYTGRYCEQEGNVDVNGVIGIEEIKLSWCVEAILPEENNYTALIRHVRSAGRGGGTRRITNANVCEMRQEIVVDYNQRVGAKHHLRGGFSRCDSPLHSLN